MPFTSMDGQLRDLTGQQAQHEHFQRAAPMFGLSTPGTFTTACPPLRRSRSRAPLRELYQNKSIKLATKATSKAVGLTFLLKLLPGRPQEDGLIALIACRGQT